jgi:heat induced stress protein YflT
MKKTTSSSSDGTVVGLFHDAAQAELAIRELKREGFAESDIGVLMRERHPERELAEATGTKMSEGATTGAIGGGLAGGVIGLLAAVGALAIPGIGPIIAGGALASTLAGAGIGAAAGGLIGALVGMGIPEEDAKFFEQGLRSGGILITVRARSRSEGARGILIRCGAELEAGRSSLRTRSLVDEPEPREEPWRGNERRYHDDAQFTGPERRTANV